MEPERLREAEDGADDAIAIAPVVAHELSVDLERRRLQLGQAGHRRVAGAEVIERDAQAEGTEPLDDAGDGIRVGSERALGDFQQHRFRRHARGADEPVDALDDARAEQGRRCEVDLQHEGGRLTAQRHEGRERLGQDLQVELGTEARLLGHRDEA